MTQAFTSIVAISTGKTPVEGAMWRAAAKRRHLLPAHRGARASQD